MIGETSESSFYFFTLCNIIGCPAVFDEVLTLDFFESKYNGKTLSAFLFVHLWIYLLVSQVKQSALGSFAGYII